MASSPAAPASYEQVVSVIHVLYSQSADSNQIRQANEWLDAWQKTPHAWQISEQILRDPSLGTGEQLFGAITLHAKARSEGHSLPPAARLSLRDALLGHLVRTAPTRRPRDNASLRVSFTVAALAVYMEEWTDPTHYLIQTYGTSLQTLRTALMVLAALPEEGSSHRISATRARRDAFSRQLDAAGPELLQFLYSWLARAGEAGSPEAALQLQSEVLRCLHAWLHASRVSPSELVASPVALAAFEALGQPALLEVAIDVVCEFIRLSQLVLVREPEKGRQLLGFVVTRVLALAPTYASAVASGGKFELTVGLARLFSEVGEKYVEFVSHASPEALQLVAVILQCTTNKNEEIASLTFNFWHELSKFLIMLPEDQRAPRSAPFAAAFGRLVDVTIEKMVLPDDYEDMTEDEQEEVKDYRRYELAHTLRDSCGIIGADETLSRIVQAFMQQASTYNGTSWRGLEATLYAARSSARCVELCDSLVLPQLLEKLPQLPKQHTLLQYTAILVVGRYAEWFCKHPDKLPPLLTYVTSGLANKDLASAAATAFKNLAGSCGRAMGAYADQVLSLFESCNAALAQKVLSADDASEVLKGVGSVVVMLPAQQYTAAVERLCTPAANALATSLNNAAQAHTALPETEITEMLRQLGLVMRFCKPPEDVPRGQRHPCLSVAERLWPLLGAVLSTYPTAGDDLIDELTRCYRCSVNCLGIHSAPLTIPLLETLAGLYRQRVVSSVLILVNAAVEALGSEDNLTESVARSASAVLDATTQALSRVEQLQQSAEVVLEAFELGMACVGRMPELFMRAQPPLAAHLLRWALVALGVQHRDAVNAALAFIEHCYRAATKPSYDTAINVAGVTHELVRGLLSCAGGVQPFNRLPEIRSSLIAIRMLDPVRSCVYAAAALGVAPPQQVIAAAGHVQVPPMGPFMFHPPADIAADVVQAMGNPQIREAEFLRILEDFGSASRRSVNL